MSFFGVTQPVVDAAAAVAQAAANVLPINSAVGAAAPGDRAPRIGRDGKPLIPSTYWANWGVWLMPEGGTTVDDLEFTSMPKGMALSGMEKTDGNSDAFRAKNAFYDLFMASPIVANLKPGERVYLCQKAEGAFDIEVLRVKDKAAVGSSETPLTNAVLSAFQRLNAQTQQPAPAPQAAAS